MPRVLVLEGDITDQAVDAVVNAANSSLMGGGGVDGAIHRRGGPAILAECKEIRRTRFPDGLPTGQAVATSGGNLPARWVIHTVGPVYGGRAEDARLLASCHTESLRVAGDLGAETIAFPAISTGAFGYPLDEAAVVAIRAVRDTEIRIGEVRFVLFGREAHRAFELALAET
jgi:O-acetyl-ADP-ribose deacetylase (regulator of RNase III)